MAKIDEAGNIINKSELKKLEVRKYKYRLRNRDIKTKYNNLRYLKENLFSIRLKLSRKRESPPWNLFQVLKVTQNLKSKKARDPSGLVFELFKPQAAGEDIINSLKLLCNKIKTECQIPQFIQMTNITSIYKSKGSRLDLDNYRGIFNVSKVRSIVDKLIYNDFYETIDSNMSDSNVGARRKRNIRDNLFVTYGVLHYVIEKNINIEVTLYDISQCFDSQWFQETMNDMWDVGLEDDCFALMAKMNETVNIAIKTSVGETKRFQLQQIEQQGTCNGPIKCSVQIDSIGRDYYEEKQDQRSTAPPLVSSYSVFFIFLFTSLEGNTPTRAKPLNNWVGHPTITTVGGDPTPTDSIAGQQKQQPFVKQLTNQSVNRILSKSISQSVTLGSSWFNKGSSIVT